MMATKFKKSKIDKSSSTDDAQRLILQSSLSLGTAGRRPRFLIRSKNKLTNKLRKSWKRGKKNNNKVPANDTFVTLPAQSAQQNPEKKKTRKRKIPKVNLRNVAIKRKRFPITYMVVCELFVFYFVFIFLKSHLAFT